MPSYSNIVSAPLSSGNLAGLTKVYANPTLLPFSGVSIGDIAYVASVGRLFIWNNGWYNIAVVNSAPSIITDVAPFTAFDTNGTPIVLTLLASDPEGMPITWSYQVTSGSLGNTATISQDGNVFTITPSDNINDAGAFSITFSAFDGIDATTVESEFTLSFAVPVDFLIVAGGGSGGNAHTTNANGGGGGGGVLYTTLLDLTPGIEYTVTVGAGGAAVPNITSDNGNRGSDSQFGSSYIANGGGGGGSSKAVALATMNGGSGGGRANPNGSGLGGGLAGLATQTSIGDATGYGFPGGTTPISWTGCGGGGAGGAGSNGANSPAGTGGNGGPGFITDISGVSKGYAGGGGGGGNSSERAGDGFHGGGRGAGTTTYYSAYTYTNEINGTTKGSGIPTAIINSGGGGGAGSYWASNGGWATGSGAGGSGIVIIRCLDSETVAATTGDPTIEVSGGYRIYTFTSSGTITF